MRKSAWYYYTLALWVANVILVIISYFVSCSPALFVLLFTAVFVGFAAFIAVQRKEQIQLMYLLKQSPVWVRVIAVASILYTFLNFFICMHLLREGGPSIQDGVYCLWNHGFIREITQEEYRTLQLAEGRMFFGHTLVFSAIPLGFFSARESNCLI